MKLMMLALDYDGTLAEHGSLGRENRLALIEARRSGVQVVLVTGRILTELAQVMGHFELFDAIVAENGAVLHFPRTGRSTLLAPPPSPRFAAELERLGLRHQVGECVVELRAADAPTAIGLVRELELPLALIFNRGALMVLPQAVSKGVGLAEAARAMRLSLHNAMAIGDAENDHDLLRVCEHGVAVQWGSETLQQAADEVLRGAGPPAVAEYLRRSVAVGHLRFQKHPRRALHLGLREDGRPQTLAVMGRNVLIAGSTQSGKSWLAGLLCEQLVLHRYCVCVVDPEGDYTSLEALPGVTVLSAGDAPPSSDAIERALRFPDVSLVIDLASLPLERKLRYVPELLAQLAAIRRRQGFPHRIVIDEAHYFLRHGASARLLDRELLGYTFVTFRVSELDPEVLDATSAVLVTHEDDAREAESLRERFGPERPAAEWAATLGGLELDEAALFPGIPETGGELLRFRIGRRLTMHVRHKHKYLTTPAACDHAFVFRRSGAETGQRAASLAELIAVLAAAPEQVYGEHLRNDDFSRWIEDVFHDNALAVDVRAIERAWRSGSQDRPHDRIVRAIVSRYGDAAAAPVAPGEELAPPTPPCP